MGKVSPKFLRKRERNRERNPHHIFFPRGSYQLRNFAITLGSRTVPFPKNFPYTLPAVYNSWSFRGEMNIEGATGLMPFLLKGPAERVELRHEFYFAKCMLI